MNELIKELADKHGLAWTLKTPYDEENLRDFTRAIVEECITACANICYDHSRAAGGVETAFDPLS